jgi:hypothetical protein
MPFRTSNTSIAGVMIFPLLMLLQFPFNFALHICQKADLSCISFEHRNISVPPLSWGDWGPQSRYLLTAVSADMCGLQHSFATTIGTTPGETILLVRMQEEDDCSVTNILTAASGMAGVILAADQVEVAEEAPSPSWLSVPAVLVSHEEGNQIMYLARIVNMKVILMFITSTMIVSYIVLLICLSLATLEQY